jgi:argininosuccinate lyase
MPQKKNPDVAELTRGKSARVIGNLCALLTLLKGLPMTYNRDLQEDKEPLFDTVDTVKACIGIFRAMIGHITFNRDRMHANASRGFAMATDVAEYLVRKGVPFREAHEIVGRIVAYCLEGGKQLSDLTLDEFRKFNAGFESDVLRCLTVEHAVAVRNLPGGTSAEAVSRRIRQIEGRS